MVEHDTPLPEIAPIIRTPEINEIARLIADNLVEDGATLQTGNLLQSSSHLSNVFSVVTPPFKIGISIYVLKTEILSPVISTYELCVKVMVGVLIVTFCNKALLKSDLKNQKASVG